MPATKKFLAFSCTHCPLVDKAALSWTLQRIAERKPDVVVHCGDGLEADSASKFPSEATWDLQEEFDSFNDTLRRVREAADGAKLVFIQGNHESNLLSINRIDKRLRGRADYRRADAVPELQNWDTSTSYVYDRRRCVWRLGQVAFAHSFGGSSPSQAIQFADPYGLLVHGHTHRPTPLRRVTYGINTPLPYWHINTGTLRQMDPSYVDRKNHNLWGQAVVVGEALVTKSPRMSRNWEAETLVYRMFDGEMVN